MSANGSPLTKADLLTALSALKDELGGEIREAKEELRGEIAEVRNEVAEVRAEQHKTRDELIEMVRDVETKLLTEFHRYASSSGCIRLN